MTTLLNFEVQGLAGRETPVRCELAPDVNVFFGLNGSGKTSLLKLLSAALRNRTDSIGRVPFTSAKISFKSDLDGRVVTRSIDKAQLSSASGHESLVEVWDEEAGFARTMSSAAPIQWDSSPSDVTQPFKCTFLSTARLAATSGRYRYEFRLERLDESRLDEIFAEEVLQLWRQYTNRLLSEVRLVQEQGLANVLSSLFSSQRLATGAGKGLDRRVLDAATAYKLTSEFMRRQGARAPGTLKTFRDLYDQDERLRSVVDDIDRTERQIAESERPRRELEKLVSEFISGGKQVTFSDRDILVKVKGSEVIPLSSLSSGEKQLLRILLAAIMSDVNSIIIDEPELSMHIDWQRSLLNRLRTLNPLAQIVVATHSPEVMADIPDSRIFRL